MSRLLGPLWPGGQDRAPRRDRTPTSIADPRPEGGSGRSGCGQPIVMRKDASLTLSDSALSR